MERTDLRTRKKVISYNCKEETITIHGKIKREPFFLSLTIHHSKRLKRNDSYRITVQKSLRSSSDRKLFHRSFIRIHCLIFFTRFDDALSLYAVYKGLSSGYDSSDTSWNFLSIFIPNAGETNLVCYPLDGNKASADTINKRYVCNSRQTNLYSIGEAIECY